MTFGCAGCARRRDDALAAAELASAPLRKVEMRWEVKHAGTIVIDEKVPASWDEDDRWRHLGYRFDEEIGAAISDAMTDILVAVEMVDIHVGDEVPAAVQPDPAQPPLFGGAS